MPGPASLVPKWQRYAAVTVVVFLLCLAGVYFFAQVSRTPYSTAQTVLYAAVATAGFVVASFAADAVRAREAARGGAVTKRGKNGKRR